jgi:hypothetical protein
MESHPVFSIRRLITPINPTDTRRIAPAFGHETAANAHPRSCPVFARTTPKIPFFRPAADMRRVLIRPA